MGSTGNNKEQLQTGNAAFDQLVEVLMSTSMLLGGVLALILDLIIPGTDEERGMSKWNSSKVSDDERTYQIGSVDDPVYSNALFNYFPESVLKFLPFLPNLEDSSNQIEMGNSNQGY